jgi:hypothetical protein
MDLTKRIRYDRLLMHIREFYDVSFMYPLLLFPGHDENRKNLYNNGNTHNAYRWDLKGWDETQNNSLNISFLAQIADIDYNNVTYLLRLPLSSYLPESILELPVLLLHK